MSLTTKQTDDLNTKQADLLKALKAGATDHARKVIADMTKTTEELSKSAVVTTEEPDTTGSFERIWKGEHSPGTEQAEFQQACDDCYLTASLMGYLKHNERNGLVTAAPEILMLKSHKALRYGFPVLYEKAKQASKFAAKIAKSSSEVDAIAKAMYSTGTALGDEWVPSQHSPKLEREVRLAAKIASLFRDIPMPTQPYDLPAQGAMPNLVSLTEQTADSPTQITQGNAATANARLSAVKVGLAVSFSGELVEDSIIPVVSYIRGELIESAAAGWDYALLNGDTTNPHQDSDVDTSTHRGRLFRGLRKSVQSAASIDGTTFTLGDIRTMRANMGKYGADPRDLVYITSVAGLMRMLGLTQVVTMDVFGPNATVLSGQLGLLDGSPVIVSSECRQDLNASGVYNGTTTSNTLLVCPNRKMWVTGTRREVTVKLWNDARYDQDQLILTFRKAFINTVSHTANNLVGQVYGIANAGT